MRHSLHSHCAGAERVPARLRDEVAAAIRMMIARNRIVAEGAGAVSVAAALSGRYAEREVCAVVSGGNIDSAALAAILEGRIPA